MWQQLGLGKEFNLSCINDYWVWTLLICDSYCHRVVINIHNARIPQKLQITHLHVWYSSISCIRRFLQLSSNHKSRMSQKHLPSELTDNSWLGRCLAALRDAMPPRLWYRIDVTSFLDAGGKFHTQGVQPSYSTARLSRLVASLIT